MRGRCASDDAASREMLRRSVVDAGTVDPGASVKAWPLVCSALPLSAAAVECAYVVRVANADACNGGVVVDTDASAVAPRQARVTLSPRVLDASAVR